MPKRVYTQAHAAIRFWSTDLDPLLITQALRLPPDSQQRNGEPLFIRTGSGNVENRGRCQHGSWCMSSKQWVESPRLHVHLIWLLEQLEPRRDEIETWIAEGVNAEFFCYSCGATAALPAIPGEVRSRADSIGIRIEIDHYDTSIDVGHHKDSM